MLNKVGINLSLDAGTLNTKRCSILVCRRCDLTTFRNTGQTIPNCYIVLAHTHTQARTDGGEVGEIYDMHKAQRFLKNYYLKLPG